MPGKKYEKWTVEDWSNVLFSDENHFLRSQPTIHSSNGRQAVA